MSSPAATVVVPTYERPRELGDVLDDLLAQDVEPGTFEVVVADSLPRTGSARKGVRARQGRPVDIRYVADPRPGAYNARHTAAAVARGEILVYIDDDVRLPRGWLATMLAAFDDDVGCVGGRVVDVWEDGTPPPWRNRVPRDFFSALDYGDAAVDLEPPLSVNSCNMAIRRELVWRAGGFHPCVFGRKRYIWLSGQGEGGLVRRLHELGVRIRYEPAAAVEHRMPAARASLEYARFRARLEGVQHSVRWTRGVDPSRARSLRQASACLLGAAFAIAQRKPVRRAYWSGRGLHQLGVALLPPFRAYVMRPTYLEDGGRLRAGG